MHTEADPKERVNPPFFHFNSMLRVVIMLGKRGKKAVEHDTLYCSLLTHFS